MVFIEVKHVLYLTSPGLGCGPWILLFATSNGMLTHEAIVPDKNPIPSFLKNSIDGS